MQRSEEREGRESDRNPAGMARWQGGRYLHNTSLQGGSRPAISLRGSRLGLAEHCRSTTVPLGILTVLNIWCPHASGLVDTLQGIVLASCPFGDLLLSPSHARDGGHESFGRVIVCAIANCRKRERLHVNAMWQPSFEIGGCRGKHVCR